jgi:hypothetical protein
MTMTDYILGVDEKVNFDETIEQYEFHTHLPYASQTLNNNDEIRIPIHQQDVYTLPSKSYLYVEGTVTKKDKGTTAGVVTLVNNAVAFLFEEIRYEIAGVEIDRTKNVGITSTMKNLLSTRLNEANILKNAGWKGLEAGTAVSDTFRFLVPLRMLLGFAEDYRRIILNVKQELVLLRSAGDINSLQASAGVDQVQLTLTKVQWKVPYVHIADAYRIELLKMVEADRPVSIPFRTWQLHEYPVLPQSTIQNWTVKTTTQTEKPRYVALAFQTKRKNVLTSDMSQFDFCDLHNFKLYLNSRYYPYDNLTGNVEQMYEMFAGFQRSYYGREESETIVSLDNFKSKCPIFLIDCSRQNESLKTGTIDIRLEFESKNNFPAQTTAYCLIIYDTIMEYTPLSGTVRRIM